MDGPSLSLPQQLAQDFRGLLGAGKDLWIIYGVKLIESVAYFAVVNVLILYLHDDLRLDDETAGLVFGSWGTLVALLTFLAGFVADAMGQRKALLIAALVAVVTRAMLASSEVPAVALVGLALGTWTVASMKPVMTAAVKTHAPPKVRAFAFSMFYVVMNAGALLAGWLVSGLRLSLLGRAIRPSEWWGGEAVVAAEGAREAMVDRVLSSHPAASGADAETAARAFWRLATGGRDAAYWTDADIGLLDAALSAEAIGAPIAAAPFGFSGYEMIFLVSAALSVLSLFLVTRLSPDRPAATPDDEAPRMVVVSAARIALRVMQEKTFWAYLLFIAVLVLVRAIFVHAHSTWPTYMLREFGEATPQAALWSLNPALIIVLTPVVGSLTSRRSAWSVIMVGSFITSASVLFMVVPGPFEAAARATLGALFGGGLDYRLAAPVLFVVTLSLGEALWSPRLYEYVAVMAPKGQEASYMGLTQLPMFAAKPLVGWMSGSLLAAYCPEAGPRQPELLWMIIFVTTVAGPFLALLFAGFIRSAEKERVRADRAAQLGSRQPRP